VRVPRARDYQAILTAAYPAAEPGAVALVVRRGKVEFRAASGQANLELGVPLAPDMVFEIGSITKQFTAAAILMLAQEGKLALDDPISRWIPDYPQPAGAATIEHLLTHTSGVASYTDIPGYMETSVRNDVSVDELIAVFKDLPLEFEPGTRWKYSNSGYILLGAIVERAGGMPYAEFVQKRIFEPLGMTHSYYGSLDQIIPQRASGYDGERGAYRNAQYLSMTQPYAAGALMMTVEDLYRWNRALFAGEVVAPEMFAKMTTPYVLKSGEATTYGYGLSIGDVRGRRAIGHGGGIFGYVTDAQYLPDEDLFVAVFSNSTGAEAGPNLVSRKLAALAIGDPFPEFREVAVDSAVLRRYVGVYRIDEGTQRFITLEDGKLYTQRSGSRRLQAIPASETHFFYRSSLSHFEMVIENGAVAGMLMYQDGSTTPERATKISDEVPKRQAIRLDPAIYDRYAGVYELQPGFDLTITREGDRLMAQATGQEKVELFPESETEFFLTVVDAQITFVVAADGSVTELILHQGGQDLPAKRKP
jgi:CubicO group peptidase (beta-lactamase class C family)